MAVGIVTVGQTNPGSCSTSLRIPPANVGLGGVVETPITLAGKELKHFYDYVWVI